VKYKNELWIKNPFIVNIGTRQSVTIILILILKCCFE